MAGSQKAEIELVAKDTSVAQAIEKLSRGLDKTVDKLNKVENASKKGTKTAESGFGDATASVGRFVAAVTGIGSVIGGIMAAAAQLRRELENLKSRQQDAATTQITVAQAQREAAANFGGDPTVRDFAAFDRRIAQIQQRTGAPMAGLYTSASSAVSARGDQTIADALDAVEIASRIDPGNAESQATIAKALLIQRSRAGGELTGHAGLQIAVKDQSLVATNRAFARHYAPGMASLANFGATPQEAGAMLATLGHSMGDAEGAMTRTSGIQFSRQVFAATADVPELRDASLGDRLRWIQSEKGSAVRKKLTGMFGKESETKDPAGLTGEAAAFMGMINLLQKGTKESEMFDRIEQGLPSVADGAGIFERKMTDIEAIPLQQQAFLKRMLDASVEGIQLADLEGGRVGIARTSLQEILKSSGVSDLEQRMAGIRFERVAGVGEVAPIDALKNIIKEEAEFTRNPASRGTATLVEAFGELTGGLGHLAGVETVPPSPAQSAAAADKLDAVVSVLERIEQIQRNAANPQQQPRQPAQAGLGRNN